MAKYSPVGKLTKVSYMSVGVIIGSMFGGAVLATAGWWYTDNLSLTIGETPDINETSPAKGDCKVGSTGTNTYTDEEGNLVTQTVQCSDDGSDIGRLKLEKTRSGYKLVPLTYDKYAQRSGNDGRPDQIIFKIQKKLNGSGPRWTVTGEKKTIIRQDLKNEVERRK